MRRIISKILTLILLKKVKRKGKNCRVNHYSKFTRNVCLGDNCNFNGIRIYGNGNVTIGNNFHSGRNTVILTSNHNYEGNKIPYDESYIDKEVVIEDNVWIGYGVLILGGSHICEGSIIQAGSVVSGRIEKCGIAGGSPAKVFKYRDIEHYENLKREEKFF